MHTSLRWLLVSGLAVGCGGQVLETPLDENGLEVVSDEESAEEEVVEPGWATSDDPSSSVETSVGGAAPEEPEEDPWSPPPEEPPEEPEQPEEPPEEPEEPEEPMEPLPEYSRVFVTSNGYVGYFIGGVAGADAICQGYVDGLELGGTWKAWISSSTTSPSERFIHQSYPYQLLDGTQVADDWHDLTDGSLDNPITVTEGGDRNSSNVWTGTVIDGTAHDDYTCDDWVPTGGLGVLGNASLTSYYWTGKDSGWGGVLAGCGNIGALYCFEQIE